MPSAERTPSVLPLRVKPPSPRGRLNSLSQNLTVLPAPSGREPLAWRESLRFCQGPHLRGGCRRRRLGEFYSPQRCAFAESGAASAASLHAPLVKKKNPVHPQTLRVSKIIDAVRKALRFPPPCPAQPAARRSAYCAVRHRCRCRSCWHCRSAPAWG